MLVLRNDRTQIRIKNGNFEYVAEFKYGYGNENHYWEVNKFIRYPNAIFPNRICSLKASSRNEAIKLLEEEGADVSEIEEGGD